MMKSIALIAVLVAVAVAVPQDINANIPDGLSNKQTDTQANIDATNQGIQALTSTLANANAKLADLEKAAAVMEADLDTMWLVLGAALVFLLNIGFTLVEAAATRKGSLPTILTKNLIICAIVAIVWWAFGYGVGFATQNNDADNAFLGNGKVFMSNDGIANSREFARWVYTYAFAVFATSIATSSLTDRGTLTAYVAIALIFGGGIYPVIVHWVWGSNGWLAVLNTNGNLGVGMMDWSGSGVVALNGATVALIATFLAGPRLRRFDSGFNKAHPGRFQAGNKVYQGLGTLLLWVGWYGFTCVSTNLSGGRAQICVKVAANTTLAAAAGGVLAFFLDVFLGEPTTDMVHVSTNPEDIDVKTKRNDIRVTLNGVLAGLVAVSAGVSVYEPWAAVVVGAIGGIHAFFGPKFIAYFGIDDPVETFSLFGLNGFWGLMAVGWFARPENVVRAYMGNGKYGIWYGGDAEQWGLQMFGGGAIFLWALVTGGILVFVLKFLNLLRVSVADEQRGLNFQLPEVEQEMKQK
eukprot:PhF_6_TR14167/c2_g1_i1/m.22661/K03320/amt, AMT, MEP; ammonium transporter, Amt family